MKSKFLLDKGVSIFILVLLFISSVIPNISGNSKNIKKQSKSKIWKRR